MLTDLVVGALSAGALAFIFLGLNPLRSKLAARARANQEGSHERA